MVQQSDRIDLLDKAIRHYTTAQKFDNADDKAFWLESIVYWSNSLMDNAPSNHDIATALGHGAAARLPGRVDHDPADRS